MARGASSTCVPVVTALAEANANPCPFCGNGVFSVPYTLANLQIVREVSKPLALLSLMYGMNFRKLGGMEELSVKRILTALLFSTVASVVQSEKGE